MIELAHRRAFSNTSADRRAAMIIGAKHEVGILLGMPKDDNEPGKIWRKCVEWMLNGGHEI
jgi:hypothetical protein